MTLVDYGLSVSKILTPVMDRKLVRSRRSSQISSNTLVSNVDPTNRIGTSMWIVVVSHSENAGCGVVAAAGYCPTE